MLLESLPTRRDGLAHVALKNILLRLFFPSHSGGGNGSKGRNTLIKKDGRHINLGSKCCVNVSSGDVFRLESPGGGAYGSAFGGSFGGSFGSDKEKSC